MDFNKIVARAKAILLTPKTEWPVIADEPATVADLYKNYIIVLAAIPATIFYNKFNAEVAKQATRLEGFADEFSAILSRQIDERAS